jgi:hypothetical protein
MWLNQEGKTCTTWNCMKCDTARRLLLQYHSEINGTMNTAFYSKKSIHQWGTTKLNALNVGHYSFDLFTIKSTNFNIRFAMILFVWKFLIRPELF